MVKNSQKESVCCSFEDYQSQYDAAIDKLIEDRSPLPESKVSDMFVARADKSVEELGQLPARVSPVDRILDRKE